MAGSCSVKMWVLIYLRVGSTAVSDVRKNVRSDPPFIPPFPPVPLLHYSHSLSIPQLNWGSIVNSPSKSGQSLADKPIFEALWDDKNTLHIIDFVWMNHNKIIWPFYWVFPEVNYITLVRWWIQCERVVAVACRNSSTRKTEYERVEWEWISPTSSTRKPGGMLWASSVGSVEKPRVKMKVKNFKPQNTSDERVGRTCFRDR